MNLARTLAIGLAGSLVLASLASCARRVSFGTLSLSAPISADGSTLCEGLADHFIGLPGASKAAPVPGAVAPPLVGRWWIRSCSATPVSGELRIRLEGPGWYWVDEKHNGLALQQQVPFNLRLEFDGRARGRTTPGLFALWLEPVREPSVEIKPAAKLEVHGRGPWGAVLSAVLPVQTMAAERFAKSASSALRDGLRGGVTLTHHIRSGQSDATIGQLVEGQMPQHPFEDGSAWLVNERLLLPSGVTHVVGPLDPGTSELDVSIERGPGLSYRALCAEDMADQYPVIARGRMAAIAPRALAASGRVVGSGAHQASVRVDHCKHYLVLSGLSRKRTLAALRVR